MSRKQIRISLYGEIHVSNPYLEQIVCRSIIKHKILDLDISFPLWTQVKQKCYEIRKVKQSYTIYVICWYSHIKMRF
jgi:hypothetical protein